MLKYVPEYVRRKAISEDFKIPHLEIVQNGIVAIIDISGKNYCIYNKNGTRTLLIPINKTKHAYDMKGYSKLTTHLGEVYGEAGGAKVKELLNPPFELIIEAVHKRNGSIIKFAGDAVIVAW